MAQLLWILLGWFKLFIIYSYDCYLIIKIVKIEVAIDLLVGLIFIFWKKGFKNESQKTQDYGFLAFYLKWNTEWYRISS